VSVVGNALRLHRFAPPDGGFASGHDTAPAASWAAKAVEVKR
jgi:hypothetical protein